MAKLTRTNHPPIANAKARNLPFQVAAVCWADLLGYGSMIAEAGLNPVDPKAKEPITRLRAFHRIVAEHSGRHYRTLVLNDGAAAYRDLSLRSSGVTHDFLARSFALFEAIQRSEQRNGWPGARMFLATGFRAKGSRRAIDRVSAQLNSILARLAAGEFEAEQAVREAASIEHYFDVLPQLQANFAFTKAYVADSAGSRAGLGGPRFFVDDAIFDGAIPTWVSAGDAIPFHDIRLAIQATFVPVTGLAPPGNSGFTIPGVRDALQIGETIAPSVSIRDAIRAFQQKAAASGQHSPRPPRNTA